MSTATSPDAVAFAEQNRLIVDTLRGADWSTPVPSCPGWTLEKLLRHIGRGDRWSAKIVADRASEPVDHRAVPEGTPPDGEAATLDWLRGGAQLLFDAVDATGPDTPVWTFIGPQPGEWWVRRRLHESLVHRADVDIALGRPFEADPALAAQSVTEFLEIIALLTADNPASGDLPVVLQATDVPDVDGGRWVLPRPNGSAAAATDATGATLTGRAADLLLVVTGRRAPADVGVSVTGDPALFDRWSEGVNF
jgi:uncharacterized protein (TIGR03083 family)